MFKTSRIFSSHLFQFFYLALAHVTRAVTFPTIHHTPVIHRSISFPGPYRLTSTGVWCIRWGRLSHNGFRGGRGIRWWVRDHSPIFRGDPNIRAVDERLLFLPLSYCAVAVFIAAPVVPYGPPPLHHAVVTCEAIGEFQLNLEHVIRGGRQSPLAVTIGLFQDMRKLLLCDGRFSDAAQPEHKEPLMIGSNVDQNLNHLPFFVSLGDDIVGVFPWVNMRLVLLVVGVTAHSAVSFVRAPLHVKTPAILLVIVVVGRVRKTVSPRCVAAGWINQAAMTKDTRQQAKHNQNQKLKLVHLYRQNLTTEKLTHYAFSKHLYTLYLHQTQNINSLY